jgi:hypothetical protein
MEAQRELSRPPRLGLFTESPQKALSLRRELTEGEHAECLKAAARLLGFVDDQQRFDLVRESFGEYKLLVQKYAQKYARRPRLNHVIQGEISNRVNGKLRTFFSEFRAFLDYMETYLNTQYGNDSKSLRTSRRHAVGSMIQASPTASCISSGVRLAFRHSDK